MLLPIGHIISTLRIDFHYTGSHFYGNATRTSMLVEYLFIPSLRTLQVEGPAFMSYMHVFPLEKRQSARLADLQLLTYSDNYLGDSS